MSALLPERVKGLLDAKYRQQHKELRKVSAGEIAQWLRGRDPGTEGLKRLAESLDARSDYLIGLGDDYGGNYALAAAKMSFDYFLKEPDVSDHQKRRCRHVWQDDSLLVLQGAPMTAEAWKAIARMIEKAAPAPPPRIGAARSA